MSKAIKVIDLLNKIANGEEVPEKIKYRNTIFEYDLDDYEEKVNNYMGQGIFDCLDFTRLNDKVEIVEEEPEIDVQEIEETSELLALKSVDMRVSTEENLKRIDKAEIDMFYKLIEVTRK